jgi:hypothetical protein
MKRFISRAMEYIAVALFMGGMCVVGLNPCITLGLWAIGVVVWHIKPQTDDDFKDVEM